MENNTKEVAIVNHERNALVPMEFTEKQVELIKTTVAKGTTNDQLALFLYTCKRTGLDPLAKQIHCVVRHTKNGPVMSLQTAIDGYRLIADRSGKYAGNDDPIYDNEEKPRKATVTVYKIVNGIRCAFTATARWEQYYPGDLQGFMWKKMPHLMLGKCAEALALRKAFPAELSGVYTNEEMQQADVVEVKAEPVRHEPPQAPQKAPSKPVEAPSTPAVTVTPVEKPKATVAKVIPAVGNEANGLVSAIFPPSNPKGPTSFALNGEKVYYKSFDKDIIDQLTAAKENEVSVTIAFKVTTSGKYTNNIIESVSVQEGTGEKPMPEPMNDSEEAPW